MTDSEDKWLLKPISNRERKRRRAEKHNRLYEEAKEAAKRPLTKQPINSRRRGKGALIIAAAMMTDPDITKLR